MLSAAVAVRFTQTLYVIEEAEGMGPFCVMLEGMHSREISVNLAVEDSGAQGTLCSSNILFSFPLIGVGLFMSSQLLNLIRILGGGIQVPQSWTIQISLSRVESI